MASDKDAPKHIIKEEAEEHADSIAGAFVGIGRSAAVVTARIVASLGRSSVAGTLSGMAEETAGYPLDLVKTRMQVSDVPVSAVTIIKDTLRNEGPMGLFRGLGPPFTFAALVNAAVFGAYGSSVEFFEKQNHGTKAPQKGGEGGGHGADAGSLSLSQVGAAGLTAGFAQSFITCPVDVIKNRMQVAGLGHGAAHTPGTPHHGAFYFAKQVIKNKGPLGLYTGMVPTLLRDVPGYGMFFFSYEFLKRSLTPAGKSSDEMSPIAVVAAGGLAGMAYHGSTYPFDVVKSRIQIQPDDKPIYNGMTDCFKKVYKAEGVAGLFKGVAPTVLRGLPANAVGFLVYELAMKMLPHHKSH